MANLQAQIPLISVPFVDKATGTINEAWFLFLVQLFRRSGGNTPVQPTDVATIVDVIGLEETFAQPSAQAPLPEMTFAPADSTSYTGAAKTVALGASPATYVATARQGFYLSGGTVSALAVNRGGTALTIGNSASDIADQRFASGTDFTPGTTTSLTLSHTFGAVSRLWVFFDGVFQGDDQIASLSGTTLTFASPIPVGTGNVYVKGLLQSALGIGSVLFELSPGDSVQVTYSSAPSVTILPR